jgi:Phage tail assembly chaperone protein
MNYILATGSTVIEYPYSIEKLRSDNPETSFPAVMSDSELSEWGVYPITEDPSPTVNEATEQAEQAAPALINDSWQVEWVISEASAEEQVIRTTKKAHEVRTLRDSGLKGSDFTQLLDFAGDANTKAKWGEFRQLLRDVPQQTGFPWDITWPVPPQED